MRVLVVAEVLGVVLVGLAWLLLGVLSLARLLERARRLEDLERRRLERRLSR